MITVQLYDQRNKAVWNAFVERAKNGSFLFNRDFMDYHADRFDDHSLMLYKNDELVAVVPANQSGNTVISHQGLTYGGVVVADDAKLSELIDTVKALLDYLHTAQVPTLVLKPIPRIYHTRLADELDWILFKLAAQLYRRDIALAIDQSTPKLPYQNRRTRAIKKAQRLTLELKSGFDELEPFWNEILIPNLCAKHGVAPVHSLDEIQRLAKRFPENIVQHTVYLGARIVAGCTLFLNRTVAHAQYISGSDVGRNEGCLDLLFDRLIDQYSAKFPIFDFGICNENNGQSINKGLLDWKEGFGARAVSHDFYEIPTANAHLLDASYVQP